MNEIETFEQIHFSPAEQLAIQDLLKSGHFGILSRVCKVLASNLRLKSVSHIGVQDGEFNAKKYCFMALGVEKIIEEIKAIEFKNSKPEPKHGIDEKDFYKDPNYSKIKDKFS